MAEKVILPYIVIAVILLALSIWFYVLHLPEPDAETIETSAEGNTKKNIFQFPNLILGTITLFAYVGVEVIAGNTIISYGAWQGTSLHIAKFFTSFTLCCMLLGYVIGIICIPKYFSQEQSLKYSAILGIGFTLATLSTSGIISVVFVALLGLSNSLMWPAIWPLAIEGLGKFTKAGAALLIVAIGGGAIIPLIYGKIADSVNPQQAYWIVIPCYLIIGFFAWYGHKLRNWKSVKI